MSEVSELIQQYQQKIDAKIAALQASGAKTEQLGAEFVKYRRTVDEMLASLNRPNGTFGEMTGGGQSKSLSARLQDNDEFKSFIEKGSRGTLRLLLDGGLFERKTLIDSTAVGSSIPGILVPERVPGIISAPQRRVRVRDLIPFSPTTNNAVEFVREVLFTNAASVTEEGSDKPESAVTFEIDHADVQCLAHWLPCTKQALSDMQGLDGFLRYRLLTGLADIEDGQLLNGSGVGNNLNGIVTQATAIAGTYAQASDTYIDQVSNAIAELEDSNYTVDGIVMHPSDWRRITRIKTDTGGANTGSYLLGGPGMSASTQLWDVPIAKTTAMPAGSFLVGQFQGSVGGFDRMQAIVEISDSHEDYFVKNKVAVRCESRITVCVYRPAAFRTGAFV